MQLGSNIPILIDTSYGMEFTNFTKCIEKLYSLEEPDHSFGLQAVFYKAN